MSRYDKIIGLGTITVEKSALLEVLRVNAAAHQEKYDDAVLAYREKATRVLTDKLARIAAGQVLDLTYLRLPKPERYTESYTRAIAMIEAHMGDTFDLSEEAYRKLYDDQWDWVNDFTNNTVAYLAQEEDPG